MTAQPDLLIAPGRIRVLGIDPGSLRCGWGVVEARGRRRIRIASGDLRPKSTRPLPWRLWFIADRLGALMLEHQPTHAAIEEQFVGRNPKTALVVGRARGAAEAAVAEHISVTPIAPKAVKAAVACSGNASKAEMQRAVRAQLGMDYLPTPDEADALAIALCGCVAAARNAT